MRHHARKAPITEKVESKPVVLFISNFEEVILQVLRKAITFYHPSFNGRNVWCIVQRSKIAQMIEDLLSFTPG